MLGDDAKEAINLLILATAPAKQGHGYASALVKKVLEIVRVSVALVISAP